MRKVLRMPTPWLRPALPSPRPAAPGAGEQGQGLVEYALIIALVALAVILLLGLLGNQLMTIFSSITSSLGAAA